MCLEEKIATLTEAVQALTAVFAAGTPPVAAQPAEVGEPYYGDEREALVAEIKAKGLRKRVASTLSCDDLRAILAEAEQDEEPVEPGGVADEPVDEPPVEPGDEPDEDLFADEPAEEEDEEEDEEEVFDKAMVRAELEEAVRAGVSQQEVVEVAIKGAGGAAKLSSVDEAKYPAVVAAARALVAKAGKEDF